MENKKTVENKWETGFDRMLVDLLFDLVSGKAIVPEFTYEEQLDYYRKEIYGEKITFDELCEFSEKFKRASKIIFPASPAQMRNKALLTKMLAGYVVLYQFYNAESYEDVCDEKSFREKCIDSGAFPKDEEYAFKKTVDHHYAQYVTGLSKEEYKSFCKMMNRFANEFEEAYQCIAEHLVGEKIFLKKDSFSAMCEKYGIKEEKRVLFKIQADALIEIKACDNSHVEYYKNLKYAWNEKFPQYPYGEEVQAYINEYKLPFVSIFGNQIRSLRKDTQLFEMLASVSIKLALADGVRNGWELDRHIRRKTYDLAMNLRECFIENKKKAISYYRLNVYHDKSFEEELNEAMVPFKKDFLYLFELIMEEINFRNRDNIISDAGKKIRDNSNIIGKYEMMISEKDALIHDLKRDLEYYENLESKRFKTEVAQYDKAIEDLFQKLCDVKYGSVFNELYLISIGKKEISMEQVKSLLNNMVFIFGSMGIEPEKVGKLGKNVKFYDDDANIIYSVDETNVKEGLNCGTLKYPGWRYKDKELSLPRVEVNIGGEDDAE